MRFDRRGKAQWSWTARKAAAAKRKQLRERAAFPLLAPLLPPAESMESIAGRRIAQAAASEAQARATLALEWRRARARLNALPPDLRARTYARWQKAGCPGSPEYLADYVSQAWRTGREP